MKHMNWKKLMGAVAAVVVAISRASAASEQELVFLGPRQYRGFSF